MDPPPESSPEQNLPPEPAARDIELPPARRRELAEKRRDFDPDKLFAEKERIAGRGRIRQFMFGSLDGLLVPLGVVSGVAGGTSNSKIVVVAGVAEAFAGALSMGAGEYLSGKSETQVHQAAIRDEDEEIAAIPDIERLEIELLFEREGLSHDDAAIVADKVTTSHRSWINTMVEKELGLSAEPEGNAVEGLAGHGRFVPAGLARAARTLPVPGGAAGVRRVGRPHDRRPVRDRPRQGTSGRDERLAQRRRGRRRSAWPRRPAAICWARSCLI